MYSNEEFENFYVRYKAEGLPKNMSIQSWCLKNKVSWNLFNKWYRDTRHRIVPVDVNGKPTDNDDDTYFQTEDIGIEKTIPVQAPVNNETIRIMVDIRMTNGMQIRQKNLSFDSLKRLVGNLEGIC